MAAVLSFYATILGRWAVLPFKASTRDTTLDHWVLGLNAYDSVIWGPA